MRVIARTAAVALVMLVTFAVSASAQTSARPPLLRLHFHSIATGVSHLQTSGSNALTFGRGNRYVLISDNGQRREIPKSRGCTFLDMAQPWVLFEFCPRFPKAQWVMLYNISTRTWRPLRCATYCGEDQFPSDSTFVLGSHWLWLENPAYCGPLEPCTPPTFVRVPNGGENTWQPSGNTVGDLQRPMLQRRVCWPIESNNDAFSVIGPLGAQQEPFTTAMVWQGKLEVRQIWTSNYEAYSVALEGCSGHPTIQLLRAGEGPDSWRITGNRHAVIWWTSGKQANAIFITGLKGFRVRLPVIPGRSGTQAITLALTAHRLYVVGANDRVWAATFPRHGV